MPDPSGPSPALAEALAACASEPIHIPGGIQSYGTLLAVGAGGEVTHCAANIAEYLGLRPDELLGRPLVEVLPEARIVPDELREGVLLHVGNLVLPAAGAVEVYAHRHAGVRFVELVPGGEEDALPVRLASALGSLVPRLEASPTEFARGLVAQTRALIGYDRVMVYQFDPFWNGEVIAEDRADPLEPFVGLWYPASDIPAQARELFQRLGTRVLADARAEPVPLVSRDALTAAPLDLSYARLRAVSPVHREYLRNMGVRGTLVASIVIRGRLWGLISCHHLVARVPTPTAVQTLDVMARFLEAQITLAEQSERVRGKALGQQFIAALSHSVAQGKEIAESLTDPQLGVMELMSAGGLAVTFEERAKYRGDAPPEAFVCRLVGWLNGRGEELFSTDRLSEVEPALAGEPLAAGVLALRIPNAPGGWVIWFRSERALSIRWAGDPRKVVVREDGRNRLSPRGSFETWLTEVEGHAVAWTTAELALAEDVIRPNLFEVLETAARKAAEAAHRESEARFQAFMDHMPAGAWVLSDESRCVFVNRFYGQLAGVDPSSVVGKSAIDLYPPDIAAEHQRNDRLALATGRVETVERFVQPDGTTGELLVVKFVIPGDRRQVLLGGVAIDITARRQAEAAVRESEEQFRSAFDYAPIGMALVALTGKWLRVNRSVCEMIGYTEAELLATDFQAIAHPDDLDADLGLVRQVLAGTLTTCQMEKRYYHKWGHVVHVLLSVSLVRDGGGSPLHFIFQIMDVTRRKEDERALAATDALLRQFIEHSPAAIAMFDREVRYVQVSNRWLTDYGLAGQNVIGRNHYELFPNLPDRWKEVHRRVLGGAVERSDEDTFHRADGSAEWLEWECRPWHDAAGEVGGLIMFGLFITERKRAEELIRASLQEKEVMLKEIHHRVKNNLQIISALLHLQSLNLPDQAVREMFEETRGRVKSMALIHERLYRAGDLAGVDLSEYIRQLADDVYRAYRVSQESVRLDLSVNVPPLPLDVAIPCGLLLNEMISNCLKHAFKGRVMGQIGVTFRWAADGNMVLSVSDDGAGFPPGIDFRTTTSFGLQLIHTLADQLHGHADLTSGDGAMVSVTFPAPKEVSQ